MKTLLALVATAFTLAAPPLAEASHGDGSLLRAIDRARSATWTCQRALGGHPPARPEYQERRTHSLAYRKWIYRTWLRREKRCESRLAERRSTVVPEPWYTLARCEHGFKPEPIWNYNGSSGFDGGLQFDPDTWSAYRRPYEPAFAYLASPAVQVAVARRVYAAQGWSAWPTCSRILGLR